MCTGAEAALIASVASAAIGTAGTVASSRAANKSAKAQADARNATLSNFLDKNNSLSEEARAALSKRLELENTAPGEAVAPLAEKRAEGANESIDRSSVSAAIPLGGNVPQVVADRASGAQSSTDVEARRRAASLAGVRSFGDLLFEKGLATQATGRDINMISGFANSNARLLPIQQDLAQISKMGAGSTLATAGGVGSALGSLGSAAAGAGVFGGGSSAGLTDAQRFANQQSGSALFAPKPQPKPVNLGF